MSNRPHPRAGSSASRPSWSSGAQERSPPSRCGSSNCRPTFGSSDSRRWEVLAPASNGRSSKLLVYNDVCCAPLAGSHNTSVSGEGCSLPTDSHGIATRARGLGFRSLCEQAMPRKAAAEAAGSVPGGCGGCLAHVARHKSC